MTTFHTEWGREGIYEIVRKMGISVAIRRTRGISTSAIITSIVKDYDVYVRRNLERGVSARELNLSFLQMKRIEIGRKIGEVGRNMRMLGGVRDEFRTATRY